MGQHQHFLRQLLLACAAGALLLLTSGCSGGGAGEASATASAPYTCTAVGAAKGARQFGMDILDVPKDATGVDVPGGYMSSLNALKSLGGSFQTLHVNWSDVEGTGSGVTSGTFTDPSNAFAALNALAVSDNVKVTVRLHPIDATGKFVPTDLSTTRFNNAALKTRAKAMVNYVFTRINPANVTRLVLGNEIDAYNPAGDTNFWLDYADFLFEMNAYVTATYPTVQVGFVITSRAATDPTLILASSGGLRAVDVFKDTGWAGVADFVGITYYPLTTNFQMKPNNQVASVFQGLVSFTSKPIHIEEIGYSSSTATLGSVNLQSEFYCEVFKAWDIHAARIPSLAILRMVDKTRADAQNVATVYGLPGNEAFIEYIRTLGIKTQDGSPKNTFNMVKTELQKRGF